MHDKPGGTHSYPELTDDLNLHLKKGKPKPSFFYVCFLFFFCCSFGLLGNGGWEERSSGQDLLKALDSGRGKNGRHFNFRRCQHLAFWLQQQLLQNPTNQSIQIHRPKVCSKCCWISLLSFLWILQSLETLQMSWW